MRLAAAQLRTVALGASPRYTENVTVKLRSSDGGMAAWRKDVAAPQLSHAIVTMTCGFTAGYQPPLLCSESQR